MRLRLDRDCGLVLVNGEQTRSFWCWKIVPSNNPHLARIVRHVDEVLKSYNQPSYYDDPIFHVSLASFPGNAEDVDTDFDDDNDDDDLSSSGRSTSEEEEDYVTVTGVHCKFGTTKEFRIDLKS